MSMYYDRQGHPMTSVQWSKDLSDKSKQRVVETMLARHWVSTVWLGLDHSFGGSSPLIFETMAFPCADGKVTDWGEVESDRYSTEEEARLGHERIVAVIREREAASSSDARLTDLESGKAIGSATDRLS